MPPKPHEIIEPSFKSALACLHRVRRLCESEVPQTPVVMAILNDIECTFGVRLTPTEGNNPFTQNEIPF